MALNRIDKGTIEPFDRLVIDEGQDLINQDYLDVLGALLKGGLSGGNWYIFCDFEKQAIYSELNEKEMIQALESRATFARFRLTINCRNTKPIGEETSFIAGFESPPFFLGKISGPPVEYFFYRNIHDQAAKLETLIDKLIDSQLDPKSISIISPYSFDCSVTNNLSFKNTGINIIQHAKDFINTKNVSFSTIRRFKGLENNHIIITDINSLIDDESRSLLYIGMSRAKLGLYLFLDSCIRKDFDRIAKRRICNEGTNN